ncbi:NAD(P)H-hydrate dehydratase [Salibacterium salarium]|uniref:Bifunctional NAD(P)H-hydrate repair enzyme n=1 Tax=Salibacterium salarium TaxID=284579 RepID=A0A3R9QFR0_9BACI|nr:NAD(P)H-hydrate dehydratase [Salibacterium salarium]RSL29425.1 NAD(P)H-hydrate dehydratase [Salibacterium salarium]
MQVVTGEEMRLIDRCAIDELGMNEEILMENAGRAAAQEIERLYAPWGDRKAAVLIGKGNNGGDGFVIARTLLETGYDLDVWLLTDVDDFKGATRYHKDLYEQFGFTWSYWSVDNKTEIRESYDIIIDAMLGTGVSGELREPYNSVSLSLETTKADVVSIDVPSGVPSGEEAVPESAVKANTTITLQAPKCSAYLYPAKHYYGKLIVVDIGLPTKAMTSVLEERKQLWQEKDVRLTLPQRSPSSYKGSHGKGLLIGGSAAMPGAPTMAVSACIYSGAGLLTAAVPESILTSVSVTNPEVMLRPLPERSGQIASEIISTDFAFESYDAVAAGPGLGRHQGTKAVVKKLLSDVDAPLLLDADALYYLPELEQLIKERRAPLILTPHPGEMARMAGVSISEVNKHRFTISRNFAEQHGCYLVLKGPFTIVTTPNGTQFVNTTGNEALARGGTGDILTGMVLGQLLQKDDLSSAISNAVYLHGLTADLAVKDDFHSYSMASSDLIRFLPLAFRSIVSSL